MNSLCSGNPNASERARAVAQDGRSAVVINRKTQTGSLLLLATKNSDVGPSRGRTLRTYTDGF